MTHPADNSQILSTADEIRVYEFGRGQASRDSEVEQLQGKVLQQEQTILDLKDTWDDHMALPAPAGHLVIPEPTPHTVLLGGSYGGADESLYLGRAKVARIFFTGNLPTDWWNNQYVQQAYNDGVRAFIVSWKGTQSGATIATNLAKRPSDVTVLGSYFHEPEDNISSTFPLSAWKARHVDHQQAMRTVGVTPVGIFMRWSLAPKSGRNIMDYACGDDGVLFDFYMNEDEGKVDPEASVALMAEAAANMGAKFTGTAETGVNMLHTSKPMAIELTKRIRQALFDEPTAAYGTWWSTNEFEFIPETADAWFLG